MKRALLTGRETRSCCAGADFEISGEGMSGSGGSWVVNVWDFGRAARETPEKEGWPFMLDGIAAVVVETSLCCVVSCRRRGVARRIQCGRREADDDG